MIISINFIKTVFNDINNFLTGSAFSLAILIDSPTNIDITNRDIKLSFDSNSLKSSAVNTSTVLSRTFNSSVVVSSLVNASFIFSLSSTFTNCVLYVVANPTNTATNDVIIWAGSTFENYNNAPFRVYEDGSFVATNATITGTINANSGTIGGFNIGNNWIKSVVGAYDGGTTGTNSQFFLYASSDGFLGYSSS